MTSIRFTTQYVRLKQHLPPVNPALVREPGEPTTYGDAATRFPYTSTKAQRDVRNPVVGDTWKEFRQYLIDNKDKWLIDFNPNSESWAKNPSYSLAEEAENVLDQMLDRNIAKYDVNHIVDDKERKKLKNWTMERLTNWINYERWNKKDREFVVPNMLSVLKYGYGDNPLREEISGEEYRNRFDVKLRRKRQREAQKAAARNK